MLSAADNELLTRTGAGTPMGRLLRRYWVPALLAEEVAEPQCPPVRVTLMGERLVVWRDADGRLGALEEGCAHRRASLFFGRNENSQSRDGNCGLRCVYHGWKYDVEGRCVDMPNEPPTSTFKDRIRLTAYPVAERGDIVWVYLGPGDDIPPLPDLEWAVVPQAHRYVSQRLQRSNFAQATEGGIDSSHVSFLHSDARLWNPDWTSAGNSSRAHLADDGSPKFFVEPTGYGLLIGARRETGDERYYWRITQWLMPWYNIVARDGDGPITAHAWVPVDDESCWAWSITFNPDRPLSKEQTDHYRRGGSVHAELIPGTYRPVRNAENDYLIDRTLQRTVSFTGIHGIAMQDVAMQESMGPIADRANEHLGSADAAVIAARRRLLAEARALAAADGAAVPSGLDPRQQRVRSASMILPRDVPWVEATAESRKAAEAHYHQHQ